MATTEERAAARESVVIPAVPGVTAVPAGGVSWSGVWSGFLFAIGVLLLLGTLGLAIGITALAPAEPGGLEGFGVGAAIWAAVTFLVALFIGGMVASRAGMVVERATGAMQGALVWVLAMLGVLVLGGAGVNLGMGALLGADARTAGALDLAAFATNDVDRIVSALESPETADAITRMTGFSRPQVESRLGAIRAEVEASRNQPEVAGRIARQGVQDLLAAGVGGPGEAARPYAMTATWVTFGALAVSLLAAVLGGAAGARRELVMRRA